MGLVPLCLYASTGGLGCGDPDPKTPRPTSTESPTDTETTPPTVDTGTPPTLPTDTGTAPTGLPPCDPPLSLVGDHPLAAPFGLVALTPSGGTGAYRYALGGDAAGSLAQAGFYLAPGEPGPTDVVQLTDEGCDGEATLEIPTVPGLVVEPASTEVLPGTSFTLSLTGGGGAATCALAESGSGATLSGCTYTAGANEGFDRVVVTDPDTDEEGEARITVATDAVVELIGSERWVLPLGAELWPESLGGSGRLSLVAAGDAVEVVGDHLVAREAGDATVTVSDRFAGQPRDVNVTVVAPFVPPSAWYGQRTQQGRSLSADIDGDGYDDVIFGSIEVNANAYYSGGVQVWAGGPGGLDPNPAWVHEGDTTFEYVGRSLALADVDGDGLLDLLVGADGADWTFNDVGEVRIFRGQPGAFFEEEPSWVLRGLISSDRAGSSVGACDLDGDGFTEVIVGAFLVEDRDIEDYPNDRGGLLVFRGGPAGPDPEPSPIRFGVVPVAGVWTASPSLRIGELGMATGDVDGDGLCDVAVGAHIARWDPAVTSGNYGFVQIYRGDAVDVLSREPVRMIANTTDSNAELGRELLLADFDGDGRDDLAVGAAYLDGSGGGSAGWVGVYLAASDDGRDPTEWLTPDDADWWQFGRKGSDFLGRDLAAADVDGDGMTDLLVGEPVGQDTADLVPNVGRVMAWSGDDVAAGGDATALEPMASWLGAVANSYWGQSLAAGDLNGDGDLDLFALAGQADDLGYDVGRPGYVLDTAITWLDMPGGPSGHEHGRSLVLFDADADGRRDLIVGSPEDGDAALGNATGAGWVFPGTSALAFGASPTRVGATPSFGSGDRFGQASVRTDFDGDGVDDLVMAGRTDAAPSSWSTAYANPADCPRGVTTSGAGIVAIWRGGSSLDRAPDWVFHPPHANDNVWVMAQADVDGDGRGDVVIGSRTWDPDGVLALLRGRAADPSGLAQVICDAEVWESTAELGTFLGDDVAAIGDVDGDGCDEVAVSAPLEDLGLSNQGIVRVLWGAGGPGCPAQFQVSTFGTLIANRQAGESLAGGGDVDGDGIPDLAVGSDGTVDDGDNVGTVWVVPGWWMRAAPRLTASPGGPFPTPVEPTPLTPDDGHYGLNGPSPTIDFGESVALVVDAGSPGTHSVAVGAPDGDIAGTFQAGGVLLYRWVPDPLGTGLPGLDPLPWGLVVGETHAPRGRFGEVLTADLSNGRPALLIGAPRSSQGGTQVGGAYVVSF